MPAKAYAAFGSKLMLGDGVTPTEAFAEVALLRSIGQPGINVDTLDTTTHQSVDAFREFIASLSDAGEVGISGLFDPAEPTHNGVSGLWAVAQARVVRNYKIVLPTGVGYQWAFKGLITAFEPGDLDHDGLQEFSGTIKISGKPVLSTVGA